MIESDLIRNLPKAYQIFYEICKEAGIDFKIIKKDDKNDYEGMPQNFNKKSKNIQKTLFLENEA